MRAKEDKRVRHLDRSSSQFHRALHSGEIPVFVSFAGNAYTTYRHSAPFVLPGWTQYSARRILLGQQLRDIRRKDRLSHRSRIGLCHTTFPVHQNRRRHPFHRLRQLRHPFRKHNRIRYLKLPYKRPHFVPAANVKRQSHHFQILWPHLPIQSHQSRSLFPARPAPARPKINQHYLSPMFAQAPAPAIHPLQNHIGSRQAHRDRRNSARPSLPVSLR